MSSKHLPGRSSCAVAVLGLLFCFAAGRLPAQEAEKPTEKTPPGPQVIHKLTAPQLQKLMAALGHETVVRSPELLIWKIHTVKVALVVRDNGQGLQFFAYYKGGGVSLEQINQWNRTRRFSRSFLDEKGNPCLKLDLDLRGGVTRKQLERFIKTCRTSFLVWAREVIKPAHDAAKGDPQPT